MEKRRKISLRLRSNLGLPTRVACKISNLLRLTNRDFEFTVPKSLLPPGLSEGDVIKVSKASPCKGNLKKTALEASDQTNILIIDKSFKLCTNFQARCYMEHFEYDITKIILGEVHKNSGA